MSDDVRANRDLMSSGHDDRPWSQLPPLSASQLTGQRFEDEFAELLGSSGMSQALSALNSRARFRFTGLYKIDPPLLRNEYLFDRENPSLSLGGEVKPLSNTYCGIVASTKRPFVAEDSAQDARLASHPARESVVSYAGVPVRTADGRIFGTLCHFDLRPRMLPPDELAILEAVSTVLSGWLPRS